MIAGWIVGVFVFWIARVVLKLAAVVEPVLTPTSAAGAPGVAARTPGAALSPPLAPSAPPLQRTTLLHRSVRGHVAASSAVFVGLVVVFTLLFDDDVLALNRSWAVGPAVRCGSHCALPRRSTIYACGMMRSFCSRGCSACLFCTG